MKQLLTTLLLIAIFLPQQIEAIRLHGVGFEWNTITTGQEFSSSGTNTSTSTAIKHSGTYSLNVNPAAAFEWFGHDFGSLTANAIYVRTYIYVNAIPTTGKAEIISMYDATGASRRVRILMDTSGNLELTDDADAQIGSDSSTLNLNQWYRVELFVDSINSDATARLDGVEFASSVSTAMGTYDAVYFGSPSAAATFDINFDDIAINSTSTNGQNSWPGEGNIVITRPTGAGDNNCTTGDWSMVNEVPPSDTLTSGSTMCELDANPTNGDFAMTDSSTAGIDSYDTISVVQVQARVREEAAGASNYILRLKSAASGTLYKTTAVDAGDGTTVRTNPNGTTAFLVSLATSTDPTTGIAWTPTGTNSIDNMQCGVGTTDGTPDTWVATVACMVEYVNGSPPAAVGATSRQSIIWIDSD